MNLLGGPLSSHFMKEDSECKSGFAAIMVLPVVSSVTSVRGKHGQCPDCSGGQYIKVIDPSTGKCETCWPCIVCQEGTGSSVGCGSVVRSGTDIHCVPCVKGINFSNSSSTEQCHPCGVCSQEHEHVSAECTQFSNGKCKCETGFYHNKTTSECQTCETYCTSDEDDDRDEKCQKDAENNDEQLLVSSSFTAISTSSSAAKSSTIYIAPTLSLSGSTKIMPVPSKAQVIHLTAESVLSVYERDSLPAAENKINVNLKHVESMKWIKGLTCSVGVFTLICVSVYFLNPKLKKFRKSREISNPSQQSFRFSTLNQHDQEIPMLGGADTSSGRPDTNGPIKDTDAINYTEGDKDDGVITICNQSVHKTELENIQRGIPMSTGGKPRRSITEVPAPAFEISDVHKCPAQDLKQATGSNLFSTVSKSVQNGMEDIPPASPHSVDTGMQPLSKSEGNNNHDLIIFSGTPPFAEETTHDSSSHLEHNTPPLNCIVHMHHPTVLFLPQSWPPSPAEIVKNNSISPGLDQPVRIAVNWSELSQNEKYSTRILEMPFKLLHDICLSLDIPRTDGKDVRMLADKLGITGRNFDRLKQAAITDNSHNPISYVLLKESFDTVNGTVGGFVDIMNVIGRRDIVDEINDWPG